MREEVLRPTTTNQALYKVQQKQLLEPTTIDVTKQSLEHGIDIEP
jgi:hypothetical protein